MSMRIRFPAVAGSFYPESSTELRLEIAQLLAAVPTGLALHPKAIIVPHAGYVYSGPIAASIYARLAGLRSTIRRIILLGPTHRVAVEGLALPSCEAFSTPLGAVPIDLQAVAEIRDLPQIVLSDSAHAHEHSLEVQLPFLQSLFDEFTLIPLAVGHTPPEAVAEVIERLWGDDETLIVVSSDLSHYLPYEVAKSTDAQTAQQIMTFKPLLSHHQACGATPINGLLQVARAHQLHVKMIDLRNSGDTAGDTSRVVGYGAFAFFEKEHYAHCPPRTGVANHCPQRHMQAAGARSPHHHAAPGIVTTGRHLRHADEKPSTPRLYRQP
ncbi:MAG: AmmeMemoRadiSam system protein B [Betaproteobacteria bacterium]